MKRLVILALVGWLSYSASAQSGKQFPMLVGQLVDGKAVDLPESVAGKHAIIGLSWSKKAQEDFETWVNPMWSKFVAKTGMMDNLYDVNLYFVPMFVGTKKAAMDNVMNRMKAKSDPDIFPYVLFYKGDLKPYQETLSLKDPSKPYLFLLDDQGVIVYSTSGMYTRKKMEEIEKILLDN